MSNQACDQLKIINFPQILSRYFIYAINWNTYQDLICLTLSIGLMAYSLTEAPETKKMREVEMLSIHLEDLIMELENISAPQFRPT